MTRKRYPNSAARRTLVSGVGAANRLGSRLPIEATISASGGDTVTLDFNVPVIVAGVPRFATDDGKSATTITMNSPTQAMVTFDGAVTASTLLNIDFEDPAVRDNTGGYLPPCGIPFPG